MAQPIWSSGFPTQAQKRAKNAFLPTNMSSTVTVESFIVHQSVSKSQFPDLVKENSTFVFTLNLFATDRAIFWCGGGKKDGKRRRALLPCL